GGKDKNSGSRPISRVLCTLSGQAPPGSAAIPLGPGLLPGSSHLPASLGRAGRGGFRRHACLFGVAPDGGCRVSPLGLATEDSSLWPYSSRRRARELPCILLCGARTFLCARPARAQRLPSRLPIAILPAQVEPINPSTEVDHEAPAL